MFDLFMYWRGLVPNLENSMDWNACADPTVIEETAERLTRRAMEVERFDGICTDDITATAIDYLCR